MDACPIEVLLYIFELACDDDGSTGRALSLVSRRVHSLSREYKYRSIAVVGLLRVAPLVAMLERLPRATQIRHLFLSSIPQTTSGGPQPLTYEKQYHGDIRDAYLKLMNIVAPTLVTCRVVCHSGRLVTLIPVSCPKLVELSFDGPFPLIPHVFHAPYFGSLRSLTFSNFIDYPSSLFDDIATQAPHLEKLSFYFAQACRNFSLDLSCALQLPSKRPSPRVPVMALPSSIKEIIVQPGSNVDPELRNAYCLRSVQELMKRKLLFMQKHDKLHRVKYVPPGPRPGVQDALKSWL